MKSYWLGMLLAGAVATPAFAQMGGAEEPSGDLQTEWFKATDTNKDGKVSYDEVLKLATERAKALADAGDDEEKQNAVWEKYAYVMDVYNFVLADTNDDRAVTVEECKAYLKKLEDGKESKYSAKDVEVVADFTWDTEVGKYDKNSDGVITKEELPEHSHDEFLNYDTDGDGKLTRKEFLEAMKKAFAELTEPDGKEGPKEGPREGPKEGPKETPVGGGEVNREAFALYTKVGRTWTTKTVSTMQGMEPMVTYMKTEVVKVGEDYAEIKVTMLDKDKKPMAFVEPTTTKIEFRIPKGGTSNPAAPKVETKDETIKVEAGEFECTLTITEANGTKTMAWTSKKYPGLVVKVVTSGTADATIELVEFKD